MSGFPGKNLAEARGDADIGEMFAAMQRAEARWTWQRWVITLSPLMIAVLVVPFGVLNVLHPSFLWLMIVLVGTAVSIALSTVVICTAFAHHARTMREEHGRHEQRLGEIYGYRRQTMEDVGIVFPQEERDRREE